jgi:hypothetical protein
MQVQVGNYVYTLAGGQPLKIQAGQKLRVFFSFSYKVAETTTIPIWGSLYQKTIGVINRVEKAQTKATITLEKSVDWQTYQGQIDIGIDSKVEAGMYGLIVELPGLKDAEAKIDDCIEVTAAPGITEWVGPLLMFGLMAGMVGMMAPMAGGKAEGME